MPGLKVLQVDKMNPGKGESRSLYANISKFCMEIYLRWMSDFILDMPNALR